MKRLLAIIMALCLCLLTPLTAFATELVAEQETENIDFLNYDFPDDAVVLHQGEDGVIYQSREKSAELASTRAMTYNQVWIDAGKYDFGSFSVENPHTLLIKTKGTLRIESNNTNAQVHITVSGNATLIFDDTLCVTDGDVFFESSNNAASYVVHYNVFSTNNTNGIRVNCWLY